MKCRYCVLLGGAEFFLWSLMFVRSLGSGSVTQTDTRFCKFSAVSSDHLLGGVISLLECYRCIPAKLDGVRWYKIINSTGLVQFLVSRFRNRQHFFSITWLIEK